MRIISGKYKGRRLPEAKNISARPTTDFAKEGLFNILENKFELDTCQVLDLFAGTGNISFEFASRGCPRIVAVDQEVACINHIKKVANEFEMIEIETKIFDSLKLISKKSSESFTIVFADPPFDFSIEQYQNLIETIFENDWIKENGILVLEHATDKTKLINSIANKSETRKYGSVSFSFFSLPIL